MKKANIILLHGALGSKAQFTSLKLSLSDHFNVYDLDFEGHGARASNSDFSIDLFAKNVVEFLQANGIVKTHIFGYSMGGYVGLKLALINPELISKIVTLGTKFNWTKEIAEQEVKMLNPDKVEEKVPAFAKQLEEVHIANDWKEVMRKTARMMTDLGGSKSLTDDDLRGISHDVLIGIGEMDRMVTIEESNQAANLLRNGNLQVIEGFKHPIEKVDMKRLAEMIEGFISAGI